MGIPWRRFSERQRRVDYMLRVKLRSGSGFARRFLCRT